MMLSRLQTALNHLRLPTIEERERAYLDASVSLVDLERREREIHSGMFRRSPFER